MSFSALQVGFICAALAYLPGCVVSWCIQPVRDEDDEDDEPTPDPTPLSPIYSLNDDVLYYLATSALPIGDGAAFVLTCKSIYDAAGGEMVLRELKDQPVVIRAQFLERLEVDFPNRILCHRCATFHSRYKNTSAFLGGEATECDWASGLILYGPQIYVLHYRQAKEIVNRLLFGPSYGRDLGQLMAQGPFIVPRPNEEVLTVYHHDLKWV